MLVWEVDEEGNPVIVGTVSSPKILKGLMPLNIRQGKS